MVNRSLVRKKSLMLLTGRLLPAMLLALLAEVITLAVSFLQNAAYKAFGVTLVSASDLLTEEAVDAFIAQFVTDRALLLKLALIGAAAAVVTFIVAAPLRFGTLRWFRAAAKGDPQPLGYALNSYGTLRDIGRSLWIYAYTGLHCLKWAALIFPVPFAVLILGYSFFCDAVAAGTGTGLSELLVGVGLLLTVAATVLFIYIITRFFLAPYIYAEGDVSAVEAVRESRERMRGQAGGLLVFMLSLIPLILLASLLCYGAATIIVTPYTQMCFAVYALELLGEAPQQKPDDIEYTVE